MDEDRNDRRRHDYLDERRLAMDAEKSGASQFDKAVLTLAAGAFGISIAFIREIAPSPTPHSEKWLERISKPSQHNNQARKLNESVEQVGVMLVPSYQPSEVLDPTDRSLHFPATAISTQFATILRRRLLPVAAMRANQVDAATLQPHSQRITVGGRVVDQTARLSSQNSRFQELLDERYFVRAGAGRVDAQRETFRVGENHDLGSFAALRLANLFTPFFAEANVPSAKDSSWFTRPWRSSKRISRAHAFPQTPLSVHCRWRRQQVEAEGKRLGKSFQRAPLRSIQRMPSTQGRDGVTGRPPWGPTGGSGNKSAISCHCSSVSSNSGSVVDPAGDSTARRDRSVMSGLLSAPLTTPEPRLRFS